MEDISKSSNNLTPEGWRQKAKLTLHFLQRKQQEYESLKREWENLKELSTKEAAPSEKVNPTRLLIS